MFEKHRSRIHLKLKFMGVIIIHEVEFKDDATAVILRGSPFFWYRASDKHAQKTKQDARLFVVLCLRCSYRKD